MVGRWVKGGCWAVFVVIGLWVSTRQGRAEKSALDRPPPPPPPVPAASQGKAFQPIGFGQLRITDADASSPMMPSDISLKSYLYGDLLDNGSSNSSENPSEIYLSLPNLPKLLADSTPFQKSDSTPLPATEIYPKVSSPVFIVSAVIVQGNGRMRTDRLTRRLRTQAGREYNPARIEEDVRTLFATQQFCDVRAAVSVDADDRVKVFYRVVDWPNVVDKVVFKGAEHFTQDELRELTGVRRGIPLNPSRNRLACQRIVEKYWEKNRPFAQCKLVKGGDRTDKEVVYEISEGPELKAIHCSFAGNQFASDGELASLLLNRVPRHYNPHLPDEMCSTLYEFYRDRGYQDVRVSVEARRRSGRGNLSLIFHIHEGLRYRVADKAELAGPPSLPLDRVHHVVEIKNGDYLTAKAVKADVRRIEDYCASQHHSVRVSAEPVWLLDQPGRARVRYEVEEILPRCQTVFDNEPSPITQHP